MFWILLVLASHVCWSVENVYTKIVVGSKFKNPYIFWVFLTLLSVMVLPFVDSKYVFLPPMGTVWWLLLASICYTLSGIPYVRAMQIEEVTRINILWNAIPVFSLGLSWAIIGDKLSGMELLAMFFLLLGAVLASIKKGKSIFKLSAAFWLMLLSCALYACYALIVRYLSKSFQFPSIFFWVVVFDAISISFAFLFKKIRYDFVQTVRLSSKSFLFLFLVVVGIGNLGVFLNQWALSLKPSALVYSFEGFQLLLVFGMAIVISKFSPNLLEEAVDKNNLILKLLALTVIMIGVILLSV